MAKVIVSPAVHNFADVLPSSRAAVMTPRPASRKSSVRPMSSRGSHRPETDLSFTPRSEQMTRSPTIAVLSPGRKSFSVMSVSSVGSPDPKRSFADVESQLREKIQKNLVEIRQAFQSFDAEKNLTVTQGEFRRVLEGFCIAFTQDQFQELLNKLGTNADGTVSYMKFLERFQHRGGTPDRLKWMSGLHRFNQTKPLKDLAFDDVESQLRTKIAGQFHGVLKSMRLFDYNRDGHIQKHELRRVLENFCFRLTDEQFDKLWYKYDMTRNGHTLQYMDFLKRLGVEAQLKASCRPSSSRVNPGQHGVKFVTVNNRPRSSRGGNGNPQVVTLKDLEQKLRAKMVENYSDIKRAFVAFDRRSDGFVTLDELKRVLQNFAFPMSDKLFEALMERCGMKASHKIGYEQFLEKFQSPRTEGNGQTIPIKPNHKFNPIREAEDPPSTDDILKLLHSKIINSFSSIKEAFLVFDDNKDGRVTKRDFRRVLESFCFRMTKAQVQELMSRIDPHNKGYISYLDFLDRFEPRETDAAHPWLYTDSSPKSLSPPAVMAWSTVEDILRSKIQENWKAIASAYVKMDQDRDGSIGQSELRSLLQRYCLQVSDDHFEMLWSRCDQNDDGTIDFQEFLNTLGIDIIGGDINGLSTRIHDESEAKANYMKSDQNVRLGLAEERATGLTKQMSADECMNILKDHIAQRSSDMRKTFVKFDTDNDGKLSRKEFKLVLDSLGLYMSDDQYRILSARLGFHKGKLPYMDFLDNFQDRRSFGVGERAPEYPAARHNLPIPLEESISAAEVEARLKSKLNEKFQDLREAFHKIDFDHNGLVTRAEFRRILDRFMFMLSDEEFDKLMSRLGVQRGGKLNYRQFLQRFQQVEKVEEGHPWLYSTHTFNETADMNYLSAEVADQILRRKAIEQMNDMAKAFLAFDQDGNGVVTKKELRKVLYRFQIPMDKSEFNKLWNKYDIDKNGHVDHREFMLRLGSEFAPGDVEGTSTKIAEENFMTIHNFRTEQKNIHEAATVNQINANSFLTAVEVEQQLRDRFRDSYESLRKAFEAVDSNRDGYVSKSELQKVLFDFHYFLDDEQFDILLERCGLTGRQKLSYLKFLEAFQDGRLSGHGRASLGTPAVRRNSRVLFESHVTLSPDQAIAKLRDKIGGNRDVMRRAFAAFDRDGVGAISREDFHQIINAFCFKMSDKQFQVLLKQVDVLKGGFVDYNDFLANFEKSDAEASRRWLENLYPSSEKPQAPSDVTHHRPRGMMDSDVEQRVREVVVARFYRLAKAFTDHDPEFRGTISRKSLQEILDEHVFRMNEDQFSHIWGQLAKSPDGRVDYREFLRKFSTRPNISRATSATPPPMSRDGRFSVEPPVSPATSPSKLLSPTSVSPPISASDVEKRIGDQVCRHWQQLQKSFRSADQANVGTVTFGQMKEVLMKHRVPLNPGELLALCRKHESATLGRVVYKDFLKHFVVTLKAQEADKLFRPKLQGSKIPTSPGVESEQLLALMARLRAQVRQHWKEMRRSFRALDSSASGSCSPVELRKVLKQFKMDLTEEEFFHLFAFYDKNMSGKISYNDFLRAHLA